MQIASQCQSNVNSLAHFRSIVYLLFMKHATKHATPTESQVVATHYFPIDTHFVWPQEKLTWTTVSTRYSCICICHIHIFRKALQKFICICKQQNIEKISISISIYDTKWNTLNVTICIKVNSHLNLTDNLFVQSRMHNLYESFLKLLKFIECFPKVLGHCSKLQMHFGEIG